ncbi:MAG: dihydrolipoyl dehydrogenase [Deltaproteobacteria bacterium]|nr:dihydrolipoyl dehydrogenase [Deltaproteobacteria bacterium]
MGGGPGGYVAAIRAAQLGAEVTLIEQEKLGGVCLNIGCIPTKALLHAASVFTEAKEGAHCGVFAEPRLDFAKVQSYKEGIVKRLVSGVGFLLKAAKVTTVFGTASFKNANTLTVKAQDGSLSELAFDKIIIATGSVPVLPPIPGIKAPQCIDSTGALSLASVPSTLLIIGGGVIGMEIATLYNDLGSKVQVVEMLDEILPMLDRDITKAVRADLSGKGVEIFTGAKVLEIKDQGAEAVVIAENNGIKEFKAEKVLVAIGRRTNTAALNLDNAGIKNDHGRITVNDKMETSLPGVYAIGDCNGRIMLAHVASDQGEIAAENALGGAAVFKADTNPSCVYTSPECAGVGLTEEQAKAQGLEYVVGKFPLQANGKALIMNGGKGLIKIIAGAKHKEILGAHIFGPRATDMIAEAALGIKLEATMDEIISTIHAHPTVAEAFREAALAVEKRAIHIPNR